MFTHNTGEFIVDASMDQAGVVSPSVSCSMGCVFCTKQRQLMVPNSFKYSAGLTFLEIKTIACILQSYRCRRLGLTAHMPLYQSNLVVLYVLLREGTV